MDIFTEKDLENIAKKKEQIEKQEIKQLEKNILLLKLFDKHYKRLFEIFDKDIEKHIIFIKAKTNIVFSNVKYLHYVKNNHQNLYNKYILLGLEDKLKTSPIEELSHSIKYYNDQNKSKESMEADKEETNSLLDYLKLKKDYIKQTKELKLYKNLFFVNSIVIFVLLSINLYLHNN